MLKLLLLVVFLMIKLFCTGKKSLLNGLMPSNLYSIRMTLC